jgi:hypothetical protein
MQDGANWEKTILAMTVLNWDKFRDFMASVRRGGVSVKEANF